MSVRPQSFHYRRKTVSMRTYSVRSESDHSLDTLEHKIYLMSIKISLKVKDFVEEQTNKTKQVAAIFYFYSFSSQLILKYKIKEINYYYVKRA